jgi:hypothetical protein
MIMDVVEMWGMVFLTKQKCCTKAHVLSRLLLNSMEVKLHIGSRVSTLEVGHGL